MNNVFVRIGCVLNVCVVRSAHTYTRNKNIHAYTEKKYKNKGKSGK